MSTTCPDCTEAQTNPHWGGYHAHCRGCSVRMLASGPGFWESADAGSITPRYRQELGELFGDDWMAGHAQVKAESNRQRGITSDK